MSASSVQQRFHTLDALRGLSALTVVLWHWPHFFFDGAMPGAVEPERLPLHPIFALFYTRGWLAVDLFFCISGFIFYRLYAESVTSRAISAGRFAWLRFSRLYPLHLVTLLLVAAGQFWVLRLQGEHFVYPFNDTRHLLLNLGMASSWGLEQGYSFNGPSWSVSVEILLYTVFFVCCRFLRWRVAVAAALVLLGLYALPSISIPLARGFSAFFVGGLAVAVFEAATASPYFPALRRWTSIAAVVAWSVTVVRADTADEINAVRWCVLLLFPLTLVALAMAETQLLPVTQRLSFLGNLSYSMYLLHFPLQLFITAVVLQLGIDRNVFYSGGVMAAFVAVLVPLSWASYHCFEVPLQQWLRRSHRMMRPTTLSPEQQGFG